MKQWNLNKQLLAGLIVGFIAIFIVQSGVRFFSTLPQLRTQERIIDFKDSQRVISALSQHFNQMQAFAYDNAVWDEMYEVIDNKNSDYLDENYDYQEIFETLNFQGLHFYNKTNELIAGYALNTAEVSKAKNTFNSLNQGLIDTLLISPETVLKEGTFVTKKGYIFLQQQPVMFISISIMPSNEKGSGNGTLVVWKLIDEKLLSQLSRTVQLELSAKFSNRTAGPIFNKNTLTNETITQHKSQLPIRHNATIQLGFLDTNEQPFMQLSFPAQPRPFNENLLDRSLRFQLIAAIILLFLFYIAINIIVIKPIKMLYQAIDQVIDTGSYAQITSINNNNEIGQLTKKLNRLLELISTQKTVLISHNDQLQKLSEIDTLTKIANRRALDNTIKKLEKNPQSIDEAISILVIDIDYFKQYNDQYGHREGDFTLAMVATALQQKTHGNTDFVARYGGEEFVIVLQNTNIKNAANVASNLRQCIESLHIKHEGSPQKMLTISIGVSGKTPGQDFIFHDLFESADKALYQAKEKGRNCIVVDN